MLINIYNLTGNANGSVFAKNMRNRVFTDSLARGSIVHETMTNKEYNYYDSRIVCKNKRKSSENGNALIYYFGNSFDLNYHVLRANPDTMTNHSALDINLEDRLDLVLYVFYGVPIQVSRSIPGYSEISRALLSLSVEDIGNVSLGSFVKLSNRLDSLLNKCIEDSYDSDRQLFLQFISTIHNNLRTLMLNLADEIIKVGKEIDLPFSYGNMGLTGFTLIPKFPMTDNNRSRLNILISEKEDCICKINPCNLGGEIIC